MTDREELIAALPADVNEAMRRLIDVVDRLGDLDKDLRKVLIAFRSALLAWAERELVAS